MLLIAVLSILLGIANASAPGCCDFEPVSGCSYTPNSWRVSYESTPITNDFYAGFTPSSNYVYLQDESSELDTDSTLTVTNELTTIVFDYYYNTPYPNTISYLSVFFEPLSLANPVQLFSTNVALDGWVHKRVPCNSDFNFCCGSRANFPCSGTFRVVGSLNNDVIDGLIAIDNLGTCGSNDNCCEFNDNTYCGYYNDPNNLVGWFWNGDIQPVIQVPLPPDGTNYVYFEFVDYSGSSPLDGIYRSVAISITQTVDFSIEYFLESPNGALGDSGLQIYFVESLSNVRTQVAYFKSPTNVWTSGNFGCDATVHDCCLGQGACAGVLELQGHIEGAGGTVFVGVNKLLQTGAC